MKERGREHLIELNPKLELGQHYSRYLVLGDLFQYPPSPLPSPPLYPLLSHSFLRHGPRPRRCWCVSRLVVASHHSPQARVKANTSSKGPQYLSPRSSDVILSEIRPIQLKAEALRSINTFLDEFLWNILSNARSLVTDRMKTGVLKILPTSLGKAALLEAEVELKAYWERTSPTTNPKVGVNDALDFPLQWSYEVSGYFGVSPYCGC